MSTTKLKGVSGAYTLAARYLHSIGITSVEQAYQALPDMRPRTVRYIWDAFQKDSEIQHQERLPSESLPLAIIQNLTDKAKEAGVSLRAVLTSVMRFGNPPERAEKVLEDIVTLGKVHKPAYRPTGLYITCIRSGEDVKLPDKVLEKREVSETEKKKNPPLVVGEWVKWNLEWMRVMTTDGLHAQLSPTADPLDVYKVPCGNVLHLPRRSDPPN